MGIGIADLLLVAVALSMDAFAVAVSSGIVSDSPNWKNIVKLAFFFGFFQFLMPVIGWLLGNGVSTYIEKIDHWVAFGYPRLVIAGDIVAGCDFDRFARKVQCRGNVGFSGIYQISRYSNNIGLRLSQHIKKSFVVFADFGVVQIRNMRDFAAVKHSGQPLARNRVFIELQRRVAPNYACGGCEQECSA